MSYPQLVSQKKVISHTRGILKMEKLKDFGPLSSPMENLVGKELKNRALMMVPLHFGMRMVEKSLKAHISKWKKARANHCLAPEWK